jgi:hypothetical protein
MTRYLLHTSLLIRCYVHIVYFLLSFQNILLNYDIGPVSVIMGCWVNDSNTLNDDCLARFEVPTALNIQVKVIWVMKPCSTMEGYQCFRDPCCLCLQGEVRRWRQHVSPKKMVSYLNITHHHNPEDLDLDDCLVANHGWITCLHVQYKWYAFSTSWLIYSPIHNTF